MNTADICSDAINTDHVLRFCTTLDSSNQKIVYLLKEVFKLQTSDIATLKSVDIQKVENVIDELNSKCSEGFINGDITEGEPPWQEMENLLESFFDIINRLNLSPGFPRDFKQRFISKAINILKLILDHGQINKHPVHALLAYFYFILSRQKTIFSDHRRLIPLREQDRSLWNRSFIQQGMAHLEQSADGQNVTLYHLESAVAAIHCMSESYQSTDWQKILSLYDKYLTVNESPYVELQRAVVISKIKGAKQGIEYINSIKNLKELETNPLLYSTLGNLNLQMHDYSTALQNYENAYDYSDMEVDREFYNQKVNICRQRLKMIENYHFYNSF